MNNQKFFIEIGDVESKFYAIVWKLLKTYIISFSD